MTGSLDGLLVVDKPAGVTSHDVVARVRKAIGTRKVGHAGTLDPMATGVLVLGVGRATRLLGYLTAHNKSYEATIRLGQSTVTDDAEGEIVSQSDATEVSQPAVASAVAELTGDISQVPAAVSAIKVDGKRSYRRVRDGEVVDLPPRPVTVTRFDVLDVRRTDSYVDVDVSIDCSSGTYVRALARDLGQKLEVGGHLTRLRRTASGMYSLEEAVSLDTVAEAAAQSPPLTPLIPLKNAVERVFPSVTLDDSQAADVRHGRAIPADLALGAEGVLGAFDESGEVLALVEVREDSLRVVAGFSG